jgi:hypothetical protein
LLQGRFQAILVEAPTWGLEVSRYLHLNPVRVKGLALGKVDRQRLRQGTVKKLDPETLQARLARLKAFRWSSYRAYVGWEARPEWLTLETVLGFCGHRGRAREMAYRQFVEQGALEGAGVDWRRKVKGQTVLGEDAFVEEAGNWLQGDEREQPALRVLARRPSWEQIVRVIEEAKGEAWKQFVDRRGDWGRDVAFWLGRKLGGKSLKQLADRVEGISYPGVSTALRHMARRLAQDERLAQHVRRMEKSLN